jgi:hypothetical protein
MPLDWRRVRRMFTAGIGFHTWRDTRCRVPIFWAPTARTPSIGKISGHSVGDVCAGCLRPLQISRTRASRIPHGETTLLRKWPFENALGNLPAIVRAFACLQLFG